jgi:hypothetical protein
MLTLDGIAHPTATDLHRGLNLLDRDLILWRVLSEAEPLDGVPRLCLGTREIWGE